MKIILAPDSFKGTFSSMQVIKYLREGFNKYFPQADIIEVPIADGGDGSLQAILHTQKGRELECLVRDPLGRQIKSKYGIIEKTAFIEMALASGINLLKENEQNPMNTSTYGTGQLISHALESGVDKIVVAIGGSATNDAGIGMAMALGVKFFDKKGRLVGQGGKNLVNIAKIDTSGLDKRLRSIPIEVMCDVNNPLTGDEGATYTYGPQKGASPENLKLLEEGMLNYHKVIKEKFEIDLNKISGSGAAGGLGGALLVYLGARLKSGIDTILDIINFDSILKGADLIITGEGRLDGQTIYNKLPVGLAKRAGDIPVIAFVGSKDQGGEKVYDYNIDGIFSVISKIRTYDEVLANKEEDIIQSVDDFMRLMKVFMSLSQ